MAKISSIFRRRGRSTAASSRPPPPPRSAGLDLELVFRKFDSNGDGRISSSELAAIFASLDHQHDPPTDDEVARMMAAADTDGDGFISFQEFLDLNRGGGGDPEEEEEEDLRSAFEVFDRDRNGVISAEELARVVRGIGEAATMSQCRKMILGVDLDGDGFISFEEFRAMMLASPGGGGAAGALVAVAKAASR